MGDCDFVEIQLQLETIENQFNALVMEVGKKLTLNKVDEKNGPRFNENTLKWEIEEDEMDELDWGTIDVEPEEQLYMYDAFIVPALNYQIIDSFSK